MLCSLKTAQAGGEDPVSRISWKRCLGIFAWTGLAVDQPPDAQKHPLNAITYLHLLTSRVWCQKTTTFLRAVPPSAMLSLRGTVLEYHNPHNEQIHSEIKM